MNKEAIEKIQQKIMSYEEFSRNSHKMPHIFEVSNKNKNVLFYGVKHSADPTNEIFNSIEERFKVFNPDLVFVEAKESLHSEIRKLSKEEVIKKFGDPGFTTHLAIQNNVKVECPEPSTQIMIKEILDSGYSRDVVFAWYVTRSLYQHKVMQNVPDYKKFTERARQKFEEMTKWEDFDYSYENAMTVFKEEIGVDIDENTDLSVKQYISPGKENTIKKISLLSWELRDTKIVEMLINRLEEHNRIFIVYGASHAVVQEPALKALMNYYDNHGDK